MIPKVIHYCWFGGANLPWDVKKCIRSWEKYCPDYEIKQWDESNFDINCHPFVQAAYKSKAWAFVSDYARLKIIYENGGVYLDTDVELLKNLDFLLENQCYLGVQQGGYLCATGLGFGATKGNPVIREMLGEYDKTEFSSDSKERIACPYLNTRAIERMGYVYTEDIWGGNGITVYPCRYFDPITVGDRENLLCEDTVSIHHYSASWLSGQARMRRKIIRLIGEEKIHRLKKLLGKAH